MVVIIAGEIVLNGIVIYHSDKQNPILKFKNTDWWGKTAIMYHVAT